MIYEGYYVPVMRMDEWVGLKNP